MNLRERWSLTWQALKLTPQPVDTVEELLASYSEPGRFYHTEKHLEECFTHFDSSTHLAFHPAEVELALWFHDAVYDTHGKNSEDRSAAWAESVLHASGAPADLAARVRELVLFTKHNAKPFGTDACLLVDIDLSILGAPVERFDEYETQIRKEYGWVTDKDFREGRGAVLREFLKHKPICSTEFFRKLLEANAKTNVVRSLKRMGFAVAN
jgi:predicted metal-dependent HD superfamily phosphohydrolase